MRAVSRRRRRRRAAKAEKDASSWGRRRRGINWSKQASERVEGWRWKVMWREQKLGEKEPIARARARRRVNISVRRGFLKKNYTAVVGGRRRGSIEISCEFCSLFDGFHASLLPFLMGFDRFGDGAGGGGVGSFGVRVFFKLAEFRRIRI